MHLQPYLMFPGTCREALDFYAGVLEGSIEHIQTVEESPMDFGPEHGHRIFNSVFVAGDVRLMASDGEPGNDPTPGRNVALFLTFSDADRQAAVFGQLVEGGQVMFPLEHGFGMVEDRYGIWWMLALQGESAS